MKQLMEERRKITVISTPALPASRAEIPLGRTYDFQSRKQIEEDIMEALEAKEVTTLGICGMGGVGKTTMAKRIMVRLKEKNVFEELFMVVASQQVEDLKIQDAIVESLGLKLDEKTLLARANKIRTRLSSMKRILIVFDDVWDKLKLEDLGIPCGNERCTILFTSRNKDVLEKMDAKVYGVEVLSDTEAWFLFREKTGSCVDAPNLLSTAEDVVRECKCLPIALITLGGALKNQTNITIWKDALQQLQNFNPEDILDDVIKDVYNPLKLSYSKLNGRPTKSLFLLCSLFPEDDEISLEELTSYCMGLRVFPNLDFASEGILEKVRGRVSSIVCILKNRFLLLNGEDEHHVRMHDVVRDVAIYIAKHEAKEEIVKFNSMHSSSEYTYQWVSVFSEKTSSLLRMHGLNSMEYFEIKDFSIFKEINKQLNLLSSENICLKSISLEIQLLKNLRTLRLEDCSLESFPVVGELRNLEILYCYYCYGIEELPVEIGNLNQLKLFDFTDCTSLKRIPPGVVSNLVELEEFKMLDNFSGWELAARAAEVQEQERRNACLNEFENLSKLTCLEIEIDDFNLAGEEISFSPNITRYRIRIGDMGYINSPHAKCMYVRLPSDINLGGWFLRFLRGADGLYLIGDGFKSLDLPQAHNMKSLRIENCSTVKEVVNSTSEFDVFPILEDLHLIRLPNLEEIYDGPVLDQSSSCTNLQELKLVDLPALKHLWKQRPNRNIVSFDKLREIKIENCNNLQNLFSFPTSIWTERDVEESHCTQKVFFPMLEKLDLWGVDKLEVIWNFPIPEESNSFRNIRELSFSRI